jgi:translation initiation factor IF-3
VIKKRYNTHKTEQIFVKANHQVRFPEVRVLGESGDFLGIMSSREALELALNQEKDLVLVMDKSNPPVVKIIELSKFKYQMQKKAADNRKKAKVQELKEMRFTPFVGENDYQAKMRKIREFLEKSNKVKLTVIFKGRQIARQDLGQEVMQRIFTDLQDIGRVSMEPKLFGKRLQAQLDPVKKK